MGSAAGEMKPVWRQEARVQTVLNNVRPSVGAVHVKYQQRVTKGTLLVTLKCPAGGGDPQDQARPAEEERMPSSLPRRNASAS